MDTIRFSFNRIAVYRSILFFLYFAAVFSIENTNPRADVYRAASTAGFSQWISYIENGVRQFGVLGFIFDDRYFFYKLLINLLTYDHFTTLCILLSAAGWVFLSLAYARLIGHRMIREGFILFVLLFSLSYPVQFWNYINTSQNLSNITNLYALIPIPLLFQTGKRYLFYVTLALVFGVVSILTRQPNVFNLLSLIALFVFMLIFKPFRILKKSYLLFSISIIVFIILFVGMNTPSKNFNYSFDMILCRRLLNPMDTYSLSIFKRFKERYRERNIAYFNRHYGIDFKKLNQDIPKDCDTPEFLFQYKMKYPERMFGNSSNFFVGCCWLITHHDLQDWIHQNSRKIYVRYLLDSIFYEAMLFFIDNCGFVYAKSYGMDDFQKRNPLNHWIGSLLFSWTQPLMKLAVDVNPDNPSNIRIRSFAKMLLLLPMPYLFFILVISVAWGMKKGVMKETKLCLFFLTCAILSSLAIIYLGSPGLALQRHAYWTNVLFNFTLILAGFTILNAVFIRRKSRVENT